MKEISVFELIAVIFVTVSAITCASNAEYIPDYWEINHGDEIYSALMKYDKNVDDMTIYEDGSYIVFTDTNRYTYAGSIEERSIEVRDQYGRPLYTYQYEQVSDISSWVNNIQPIYQ